MIASGDMPAWRNGLARWTSNPKVVGSTPTVGAFLFIFLLGEWGMITYTILKDSRRVYICVF